MADVFIVNSAGVTHSVTESHPAAAQARNHEGGFRLATDEEIRRALKAWGQPGLIAEILPKKGGK